MVQMTHIGIATDHKGIVDNQQIIHALLLCQLCQIQRRLAALVELSGVDDDDLAVVAGEEGHKGIAVHICIPLFQIPNPARKGAAFFWNCQNPLRLHLPVKIHKTAHFCRLSPRY